MELKFDEVAFDLKDKVVRAKATFVDEDAEAQFTGVVVKDEEFVAILDQLAQKVVARFSAPRWAEEDVPKAEATPKTKKTAQDDIDLDAALGT